MSIFHLFNIVTNKKEIPEAVLVRALEPVKRISIMQERRKMKKNLLSSPGSLTQALGITTFDNGSSLLKNRL